MLRRSVASSKRGTRTETPSLRVRLWHVRLGVSVLWLPSRRFGEEVGNGRCDQRIVEDREVAHLSDLEGAAAEARKRGRRRRVNDVVVGRGETEELRRR